MFQLPSYLRNMTNAFVNNQRRILFPENVQNAFNDFPHKKLQIIIHHLNNIYSLEKKKGINDNQINRLLYLQQLSYFLLYFQLPHCAL